jgi:hypothetical protein
LLFSVMLAAVVKASAANIISHNIIIKAPLDS